MTKKIEIGGIRVTQGQIWQGATNPCYYIINQNLEAINLNYPLISGVNVGDAEGLEIHLVAESFDDFIQLVREEDEND